MFNKFFERDFRDFGFSDDEEDFFSFGGGFGKNFGKKFSSNFGNHMQSSNTGSVSKSVQKTTQIMYIIFLKIFYTCIEMERECQRQSRLLLTRMEIRM